jgi:4-amino-4-deoxy-L-arabinose transferase-like glycosyltransferase
MPRIPSWIFVIIALLYFSAIRVDIMDIDASQYAEISREMAVNGERLHIYDKGVNYLDKPPMLFWLSSYSMQLFGATNFAYKLPSLLLALLAIYATYRLAKHFYDESTSRIAALVLASCQGMFLMTNDIRCDLALMAWVITGMWLLQEWISRKKWLYLILSSLAFGAALMTKGPIGIIAPVLAFGSHWMLRREWKNILKWQYLIAILIIGISLIPMCIGLYQQYDLYPEKFVNGKNHESGLKFFFWTQSFGRITGENVWNNGADLSFQIVNMLWSFLPWIFLLIPAIVYYVKQLYQQKFLLHQNQEAISLGGFILCYFAVGLSTYLLPFH